MPPMDVFRAFLSLTSKKKNFNPSDLQQADVVTAFLQADHDLNSDDEVSLIPPREHPDFSEGYWKMLKACNGLRDSPRARYLHRDSFYLEKTWMGAYCF